MSSNNEDTPKKFIDVIDKPTRENLIRLEQKIKGLQAEVQAKLEAIEKYSEEDPGKKEQLVLFDRTLGLALEGVSELMDKEISPEITQDEFVESNRSKLNAFANQVTESLKYVTKEVGEI